jgi:hypothetical protein
MKEILIFIVLTLISSAALQSNTDVEWTHYSDLPIGRTQGGFVLCMIFYTVSEVVQIEVPRLIITNMTLSQINGQKKHL